MPSRTTVVSRFRAKLAAKVLNAVGGGLLTVFLARTLTSSGYGLLFFAFSVISIGGFVAKLGFGAAAARYIAEFKERKSEQVYHVIRYSTAYVLLTSVAATAAFVTFPSQLAAILNEPDLAVLLLIGAVYILMDSLYSYTVHLLEGFERIRLSALANILFTTTEIIAVISLVTLGLGAAGALWGYTIGYFVAFIGAVVMLFSVVYPSYLPDSEPEEDLSRRILGYNVSISVTRTGNLVDKRLDTVLVGFFLGATPVSYYALGNQISTFVRSPATALGESLAPSYGTAKSRDEISHASRVYERAVTHTLMLYIPAAAGLVIVAEPTITYVFGAEYGGAVPVVQLFSIYIVLQGIMDNTSIALDFLGRARSRAVARGVTAIANLALNLVLIPRFGVMGAVVATLITYSTYTAITLYVISTELKLRMYGLGRTLSLIGLTTIVMSAVVFVLVDYVEGITSLLVVIFAGLLVWTVSALGVGLFETDDITSLLP